MVKHPRSRGHLGWLASALAIVVAGCGVTLPKLEPGAVPPLPTDVARPAGEPAATGAPSIATTPPNSGSQAPSASAAPVILGFKRPDVVLYVDPESQSGEKVRSSTLPVPLPFRDRAPNGRLCVDTILGTRWIAGEDVVERPN